MNKYNLEKAKAIFNEGVVVINNAFFNFENFQNYIANMWKDTNYVIKRHKQYVNDNNFDDYVITRSLYNPETKEMENLGVRIHKNYTFEKYFRFIVGADIFHMNREDLKKFVHNH